MAKTVSVAELGHGGASRAIRQAEQEPVLVSKANHPTAWIVSAERLAQISAARGVESDIYQRAMELLAIDLYRDEVLTLGQAAKLSGMSLSDFIDLCGRLRVPILWESAESMESDVDAWSVLLERPQSDA
ncbi:MAG TPA: UPF0175 family protein, partial [Chloroflexota bacterium]|nr:UPF0175 family protein [Chloroflexota bacterium]